ncbi:MAG: PAS domain S-box protein [Alphaproteobacteria bacterium]|nr:PAS domain S-box protein [Alphaproteobacteria bacterium]
MNPFNKLSHKFLFLWGLSIVLSLSVVWAFFSFSLGRYHERIARDSLTTSFQKISVQMQSHAENSRAVAESLARNKDIVSTLNLLSRYQDINNYDSPLFDPEKRKLTTKLGDQRVIGDHHYIAALDAKLNLAAFHMDRGINKEKKGFASYNNGQMVLLTATVGERDYSPLKRLPDILTTHDIEKIPEKTKSYYHSIGGNFHHFIAVPIVRKRLNKATQTVGVLIYANILGEQFTKNMSYLTGNQVALYNPLFTGAESEEIEKPKRSGQPPDLFTQPGKYRELGMRRFFAGVAKIPTHNGDALAPIFVGINKEQLLSSVQTFRQSVLWAFLFFAIILFPIGAYAIRRMLTRPIANLMGGVEALSQGDFKGLREFRSNDELGVMARSFNAMAQTIEARERDLAESEQRFRGVVDTSPAGISLRDPKGRFLLVNDKLAGWLDSNTRDIIGQSRSGFFPAQSEAKMQQADEQVLAGRMMVSEAVLPYPDGVERSVIIQKVPVRDADGNISAIAATVIDVSELKNAEDQIKESQARFSEILDIAPEAVIATDRNLKISVFNKSAERIFGYRADEALGQEIESLIPERFRQTHHQRVESFEQSPDGYRLMNQRQEVRGLRKDGTEFPASASVSKLEYGDEKIFTVMLQDITERQKAQDELLAAKGDAEQANKAKSDFLASISHELRTPLNAILGFAEILKLQYLGPLNAEKYAEYAGDIHSSGKHLLSLVNDLLDISTIEAGKQSLTKEFLNLQEVLEESITIVARKAEEKSINLATQVSGEVPTLMADRRALRQILLNLLSNAIKFTPEGGDVSILAQISKQNTVLKVTDTGKGIPEDQLIDLTDPFTRIEQEPYRAVEGWGLGLAITKSLIDLHEGQLDIQSQLGKGTTVTVTIPSSTV